MDMPPRLSSKTMLRFGLVLVAISIVIAVITQALFGQQTSDLLAHVPMWAFSVLSWCQLTAQVLGWALVAVSFGVRALEPSGHLTEASPSESRF